MPKYISLEIPEPCHENWDQMSPREHGRYCGSCEKTVIDFSNMTNNQLAEFFKKIPGNVCGRFYEDQLERKITVPKKPWPLAKYFFTVSIPVFLLSLKSSGQMKVGEIMAKPVVTASAAGNAAGYFVIKGKVIDETGEAIPGASVFVNGMKIGVPTEVDGSFRLKIPEGKNVLRTSAAGYMENLTQINNKDSVLITLKSSVQKLETVIITSVNNPHPKRQMVGGAVMSGVYTTKNSVKKTEPVKIEAAVAEIKIYPNPVAAKSTLNITWPEKTTDKQFAEIFSANGDLVQTGFADPAYKNNSASIQIGNLHHGYYIVRVTNMKTGKKFSKEFLVLQ